MQLQLEREMFELQSTAATKPKQSVYRAIQLQTYWKTIVANARESELRNTALLQDVTTVQSNLQTLQERTDKLHELQKLYEQQVNRLYPGWREKAMQQQKMLQQQQQQQQEPQLQQSSHQKQSQQGTTSSVQEPPQNAGYVSLPDSQVEVYRISHTMPVDRPSHTLSQPLASTLDSASKSHTDIFKNASYTQPNIANKNPSGKLSSDKPKSYNSREAVLAASQKQSEARKTSDQLESNPYTDKDRTDAEIVSDFDDESFSHTRDKSTDSPSKSRLKSAQAKSSFDVSSSDQSHSGPSSKLTFQGLVHLLKELEDMLKFTSDKNLVYRGNIAPQSVQDEIINCGNQGNTLSHLSASSVSMVILSQLQLISWNLKDACLLSDKLLVSVHDNVTSAEFREKMPPSSRPLWDRLLSHFVTLLSDKAMSVNEIADTFALQLIGRKSKLGEKAKQLLIALLVKVSVSSTAPTSVSASDASVTSPTRPPRNRKSSTPITKHSDSDVNNVGRPEQPLKAEESAGRTSSQKQSLMFLASSIHADDSESDGYLEPDVQNKLDLFDHQPPKSSSTTQLTQTAAYRQLLNSTVNSSQHIYHEADDDDYDEIEYQVAMQSSKHGSRPNSISPRKSESP